MLKLKKTYITPEEYFEIEEAAEYKSEYYHGEMFAMSGASYHHNVVAMNVAGTLYSALRLAVHRITFDEAVECFFSDFEIRRNKKYKDRYQLIGITDGGRQLKIIFQLKPKNVVRIITGWSI